MTPLHKILVALVVAPILFYLLPVIFDFFGVPSRTYMIYVVWLMALIVLSAILPSKLPNMFSTEGT